jgi:dienelactone hydrolase
MRFGVHRLLGGLLLLTACGDLAEEDARLDGRRGVGGSDAGATGGSDPGSSRGGAGGSGGSGIGGAGPAGTGGSAGSGFGGAGRAGAGGVGVGGAGPAGAGGAGVGGVGGAGPAGAGGVGVGGASGTGPAGAGGVGVGGAGGAGPADAGGAGGIGGTGGKGGTDAGAGKGTCCPSGDCLCHGPAPTGLTSKGGPFKTATFMLPAGTVHYPTDAEPPFAGVSICPGFTNSGPEMAPWGPFYASHGIVTVVTNTIGTDGPDIRATKLLTAITQLKAENTKSGSPLNGKLAGRYGTSGYSMGGGGTTLASNTDATLKTSIGLAAWGGSGMGVTVPTLLLCGSADTVAPCSMSESVYPAIGASTPKMMVNIAGANHFSWFNPADAGGGNSGETALAFQKVFLEGDERWRPFLLQSRGTKTTNIK